MRKGRIIRQPSMKGAMIRLPGREQPPHHTVAAWREVPTAVPADWSDILHGIFSACPDTPLAKAGGELIAEKSYQSPANRKQSTQNQQKPTNSEPSLTFEERCERAISEAQRMAADGYYGERAKIIALGEDVFGGGR